MKHSVRLLHVLQHVPYEDAGLVGEWAKARGIELKRHRMFEGALPGQPQEGEAVLILGGPMNIYQDVDYPWLEAERDWITKAQEKGVPMLGICLGAQLIAHAGGSKVYQNTVPEIGWMPIRWVDETFRAAFDLPDCMSVLHWHGDTFDLPEGARWLATSDACKNQAYLLGRSLAFQFHMEATAFECEGMIEHSQAKLKRVLPTIQSEKEIREGLISHGQHIREPLGKMLDWHFLGIGES